MEFLRPTTWRAALEARAAHPEATPLAGGTDVMVEINFGHRRPSALLDLTSVDELNQWSEHDGMVRIGAGLPYTTLIDELGHRLPGLAIASRTVGSPQIRNRGTVGGNLGSASPAGDAHPPLIAGDAEIEVESVRGSRRIAATDFFTGVKSNSLAPDELIAAIHVPPASGPQQFSKIGTRNAMVIAVCTFAIALHPEQRRVGTALGSAAPTPRRATRAEVFLGEELGHAWEQPEPLPEELSRHFGELVVEEASPIDDVRGTANYRKHALGVLARRTLNWAWEEYRTGRQSCA